MGFGRLEAGDADSEGAVGGRVLVGLTSLRPERVSSAGAYSIEDSLEWESGDEDLENVVRMLDASESVRFRFREVRPVAVSGVGACVVGGAEVLSELMIVYFGFLGPRFMPGRPRPRPLPETTVPSSSLYCLTLRADVVT